MFALTGSSNVLFLLLEEIRDTNSRELFYQTESMSQFSRLNEQKDSLARVADNLLGAFARRCGNGLRE